MLSCDQSLHFASHVFLGMSPTNTQELDAWNCAALVQLCLLSGKSTPSPLSLTDHYPLFLLPDSHGIMIIQAALHSGKKGRSLTPWLPSNHSSGDYKDLTSYSRLHSYKGTFMLLFNPYNNHLREGSTSQIRNWDYNMWGDMSKVTQIVSARPRLAPIGESKGKRNLPCYRRCLGWGQLILRGLKYQHQTVSPNS